jgi:two-component system alkaline phosphatase synthesis response regulator PhoP
MVQERELRGIEFIMKPLIYIVEDDTSLQELYTYSLENEFNCRCFDSGDAFFAKLASETPGLVLLDVMLPGNNGFSILSRMKSERKYVDIPVIMVSAKSEEISKVKGLNLGANDYIAKPFSVLELIARIKANLRKNKTTKNDIAPVIYKDIVIDRAKHRITVNSNIVQMTLKEYNLLLLLCENADKVQEREVIFTEVWGNDFIGETRTLDIHIKELRKKLAEAQSQASIQTIRGVGYMLV